MTLFCRCLISLKEKKWKRVSSEREQGRAELIDELMHECEQVFMAQSIVRQQFIEANRT